MPAAILAVDFRQRKLVKVATTKEELHRYHTRCDREIVTFLRNLKKRTSAREYVWVLEAISSPHHYADLADPFLVELANKYFGLLH